MTTGLTREECIAGANLARIAEFHVGRLAQRATDDLLRRRDQEGVEKGETTAGLPRHCKSESEWTLGYQE